MGHNLATWKTLEDMLIELKKADITIPSNIMEDLRSAKSMIKVAAAEGSQGDALMKAEEFLANVEAFCVNEGQKVFGAKHVDRWLEILEEAGGIEDCEDAFDEGKFVTGVPRDQKWVRVEPIEKLSPSLIEQFAKEQSLEIKVQTDGRLLVHGQPEKIKAFVKKMTFEQQKDKKNL
jgi:hypothetical protein